MHSTPDHAYPARCPIPCLAEEDHDEPSAHGGGHYLAIAGSKGQPTVKEGGMSTLQVAANRHGRTDDPPAAAAAIGVKVGGGGQGYGRCLVVGGPLPMVVVLLP